MMTQTIQPIRTITDLTAATPVEIDTALEDLDRRQSAVGNRVAAMAVSETVSDPAKVANVINLLADMHREIGRLESEFERRGGWTRYIVVAGGHVHSGWFCAGGSIRWNTLRGHFPKLSGATAEQAIAELDTDMCSKCFPNAPIIERQRPADECPGSGKSLDRKAGKSRVGYAYGNCGTCPDCHQVVSITSAWNYRKHDTAEAVERKAAAKMKEQGKILVDGEAKTPRAIRIAAGDAAFWAMYPNGVWSPQSTGEHAKETTRFEKLTTILAEHEGTDVDALRQDIITKQQRKYK